MKLIIVLINILFMFIRIEGFTQEIVIPKDTIILNYSNYAENCKYSDILDKLKWKKERGIQFNLSGEAILFYSDKGKSDTLKTNKIKNFKFTKIKDIENLKEKWYKKTKPLLIKKYGIPYPNTINKNNMFITYLIEEQEDFFIKYRVYWRHQ